MRTAILAVVFSLLAVGIAAEPVTGSVDLPTAAGKAVHFTLPEGWSAVAGGGRLVLLPPQKTPHIQVWAVAQPTVAAAVAALATTVADEVKQLKPGTTADLALGAIQAKHVIADGVEADDGDPAKAEAFVFMVGTQVVVACAHGEGDGAAQRRSELTALLGTATAR